MEKAVFWPNRRDNACYIIKTMLGLFVCALKDTATSPNAERAAAVLSALNIASTDTVRKAYYNIILKGRRIPDDEGEFALDIIFNNRVYDLATVYTFGSLTSLMETVCASSGDILASSVESIKGTVESAINKLAEDYAEFND